MALQNTAILARRATKDGLTALFPLVLGLAAINLVAARLASRGIDPRQASSNCILAASLLNMIIGAPFPRDREMTIAVGIAITSALILSTTMPTESGHVYAALLACCCILAGAFCRTLLNARNRVGALLVAPAVASLAILPWWLLSRAPGNEGLLASLEVLVGVCAAKWCSARR